MEIILTDKDRYTLFTFSKESELEEHIIEHSEKIFGKNRIYLDIKKKMKITGLATIPDGFIMDLSIPDDPLFIIVEIELARHSIEHISSQIVKFEISFKDNREKLYQMIKDEIEENFKAKELLKNAVNQSRFKDISDIAYNMIFSKPHEIWIIIDKEKAEILQRIKETLTFEFAKINVIEFKTFTPEIFEGLAEDHIHQFPQLIGEEEEVIKEEKMEDIWYDLIYEQYVDPKIDKKQFFEEYRIKVVQAFAYAKKEGKIEGIIFPGYRSHIERHLEKGSTSWGTPRPISLENLFLGMDVYVVETEYDRTAGKKTEDPKVRIRGKLKEVYKMKGERKIEKLL